MPLPGGRRLEHIPWDDKKVDSARPIEGEESGLSVASRARGGQENDHATRAEELKEGRDLSGGRRGNCAHDCASRVEISDNASQLGPTRLEIDSK